jgi:hypothetical protein
MNLCTYLREVLAYSWLLRIVVTEIPCYTSQIQSRIEKYGISLKRSSQLKLGVPPPSTGHSRTGRSMTLYSDAGENKPVVDPGPSSEFFLDCSRCKIDNCSSVGDVVMMSKRAGDKMVDGYTPVAARAFNCASKPGILHAIPGLPSTPLALLRLFNCQCAHYISCQIEAPSPCIAHTTSLIVPSITPWHF